MSAPTPPPGFPPPGPPQGWGAPQGPPPGYLPQFGGPTPPPPKRNPKALLVTLLAAGAVLVVVVLVGVIVLGAGQSGDPKRKVASTPREVVQAYLEALASGDADVALSFGNAKPASKQFLTDEILRKQIEMSPITNIKVTDDPSKNDYGPTPDAGKLEVSADFGDEYSQSQLWVRKFRDEWKFDSSMVKLAVGTPGLENKSMESLTIFGTPIADADSVYVFPGALDVGSTSPFVDVEADPVLLEAMTSGAYGTGLMARVTLNDEGRIASKEAVDRMLRECIVPNSPPECPKYEYSPDIDPNSVRFKGTQGLQGMTHIFNQFTMTNTVIGSGELVVSAQTASGPKTLTTSLFVSGTVDLTEDPPVYTRK